MSAISVRPIAFYLPQYHPIPENDAWWGAGFTEWSNVREARPLFPQHYQPHVPAGLGYYDLRDPEIRAAQARLAHDYGVFAFCYYHYWFNGKQLLERPFQEVLQSGAPGMPFCLCWANENWTRAWDGDTRSLLIAQHYSPEDDRAHMRALAPALRDARYLRVGGRPLFLIYNASALPDPVATTSVWREEARRLGIGELYLAKVESVRDRRAAPVALGFDAAVEFQPDTAALLTPREKLYWRLARRADLRRGALVIDYGDWARRASRAAPPPYRRFPCVTPGWDNSARRASGAFILNHSTPERYEEWLRAAVARLGSSASVENLVFINAWNEWAEGNHLEPDEKWGARYLEATRRVVGRA